jgi:hypothetical protein
MEQEETPSYPFDEFWGHFLELSNAWELEKSMLKFKSRGKVPPLSFFENLARIDQYMETRVSREDFIDKTAMFMMIFHYVVEHIKDFDESDYAVVGSSDSGALVGKHFMMAVHHWYTSRAPEDFEDGPNVDEIKTLAKEFRKTF